MPFSVRYRLIIGDQLGKTYIHSSMRRTAETDITRHERFEDFESLHGRELGHSADVRSAVGVAQGAHAANRIPVVFFRLSAVLHRVIYGKGGVQCLH